MGFRSMCALTLSGILLSCGCETKAQQEFAAFQAVKNLRLPNRPGEVDLYYSTCCRERAIEVQNTLEDYLRFYEKKLGIHVQFALSVSQQISRCGPHAGVTTTTTPERTSS